ncbi:MAG TPA: hypothetical protein VMU12_02005 [Candidatus Paceibacterota bacterium]|nr:hypothetical protein [Candidatus Paceibacterota bacterium]
MNRFCLLFSLLLIAVPASAQTELRADIGLSDVAHYTHGPRTGRFGFGVEWPTYWGFRTSVTITKEGTYRADGFGIEAAVGRRYSLPWRLTGTARIGSWLTMESVPYNSLSFTEGSARHWTWRHVMLNGPVDSTALIPFVSFGVQRQVYWHFFCEAQLRLSMIWTETDFAWGAAGAMKAESDRSRTVVPGYALGIGYRF